MHIEVESLIAIFTILGGKIYLLTKDKNLINIKILDDIEKVNREYINKNLKIKNLDLKQCYTFSKKNNNIFNLSILYVDIVNYGDINIGNYELVEINSIKKNIYLNKCIEFLKKHLLLYSTMKKLFPSEFTLPEIQKIYEYILDVKIDRRNFRKKLIKLNIIKDIKKTDLKRNGRPAKLYIFNEIVQDKYLL